MKEFKYNKEFDKWELSDDILEFLKIQKTEIMNTITPLSIIDTRNQNSVGTIISLKERVFFLVFLNSTLGEFEKKIQYKTDEKYLLVIEIKNTELSNFIIFHLLYDESLFLSNISYMFLQKELGLIEMDGLDVILNEKQELELSDILKDIISNQKDEFSRNVYEL